MTLLLILLCIFGGVGLIVILTERFGKPYTQEQQGKMSKIIIVLVFVMLIAALIKSMTG